MIRQLFASYRRSQSAGTICRHARLEALTLESRLAPTGADLVPLSITPPAIVTVAPQPSAVTAPSTQAACTVRTDLFGHAAPSTEEANEETDEEWGDSIEW